MSKSVAIIFSGILLSITLAVLGLLGIKAYKKQCNPSTDVARNVTMDSYKDQQIAQLNSQLLQARQLVEKLRIANASCSAGGAQSTTIQKEVVTQKCVTEGNYVPKSAKKLPPSPQQTYNRADVAVLDTNNLEIQEPEEALVLPDPFSEDLLIQNEINEVLGGTNESYGSDLILSPDTINGDTILYGNNGGYGGNYNNGPHYGGGGGGGGNFSAGAPVPGMVLPFLGALGLIGSKRKKKIKKSNK